MFKVPFLPFQMDAKHISATPLTSHTATHPPRPLTSPLYRLTLNDVFFIGCVPSLAASYLFLHGWLIFPTGLGVSQGSCGEMGDHAGGGNGEGVMGRGSAACEPDRKREELGEEPIPEAPQVMWF